jgi:DNA primase
MKKSILEVIVELTGETPVQYSGELKAIRCPFHDDKKPSLVIYESTSSYFCYPCSMGGDMYNFYSRFKECSYRQAKEAIDGNSNTLQEVTEYLDGLHVKEETTFNDELNITVSKYCRDLLYRRPELVNNVMEFLKNLDKVLQSPVNSVIMKEQIERSRKLDK